MLTGIIPIVWKQVVSRPDQLLPYYVMDIAASIPGLPGLFVAGILSAALRYATGSGYTLSVSSSLKIRRIFPLADLYHILY
jgi:hypothetical protein